jgi:hypothetical protein
VRLALCADNFPSPELASSLLRSLRDKDDPLYCCTNSCAALKKVVKEHLSLLGKRKRDDGQGV